MKKTILFCAMLAFVFLGGVFFGNFLEKTITFKPDHFDTLWEKISSHDDFVNHIVGHTILFEISMYSEDSVAEDNLSFGGTIQVTAKKIFGFGRLQVKMEFLKEGSPKTVATIDQKGISIPSDYNIDQRIIVETMPLFLRMYQAEREEKYLRTSLTDLGVDPDCI